VSFVKFVGKFTLKWIAAKSHMGRWSHVSKLLSQKKAKNGNN